ncbi:hypothetical protein Gotur_002595 [Gossypium turneri]
MYTSPTIHPSDCRNEEALINDDVNVGKAETSSTIVTVTIPIADSSAPIALDKGMSSFSTWTIGQKQNPNLDVGVENSFGGVNVTMLRIRIRKLGEGG